MVADPAVAWRNKQNAATGLAAEKAGLEECLRRGARAVWRPKGQTIRRANNDIFSLFDAMVAFPGALWLIQFRATKYPPDLLSGQWQALRAMPDVPGILYVLAWLRPGDGGWRLWRLTPDGGMCPSTWPEGAA